MFKKISAASLYISNEIYWLESRFHFSFAGYYDKSRMNFGVLRVLNDDLVQPSEGFSTHPHNNMEIISYVVDGGLTHQDSMGTKETLYRGSVQYMSAGTGVTHSEYNDSASDILRFLQIWIVPDKRGHIPRYGSKVFTLADRLNKIQHLVGNEQDPTRPETVIPIHQDANIFVSELEERKHVTFTLKPSRQIYGVCIEGSLLFNTASDGSEKLAMRDGVKIRNEGTTPVDIDISSEDSKGHFLMIEMALSA